MIRKQKYEISNYMETRNIDHELQTKVFQYLEMLRQKKEQEPTSGQDILEIMNQKLRDSIYQNYFGRHLSKWQLFSNNFSQSFLEQLSISCKEQVFGSGEIIYYQQKNNQPYFEDKSSTFNQCNQYVHLILKGKVVLFEDNIKYTQNNKKPDISCYKTTYNDGECFGLKEFICGKPYEYTAQSRGLTTVLKIQRLDFLEIIKRYPKDYVIIFQQTYNFQSKSIDI